MTHHTLSYSYGNTSKIIICSQIAQVSKQSWSDRTEDLPGPKHLSNVTDTLTDTWKQTQ